MGSTDFLKVAVIMHAIMAYLMLSDDQLLPGDETIINFNDESGGQFKRL